MRKILVMSCVVLVLATGSGFAEPAMGSAFGTLTTAQAMGQGTGDFGFGLGLADATSFIGTFAYGLSTYSDGRIKLALYDPGKGADAELTFGVDYKWQFWSYGPESNHPFDFAFGGFLEYGDFGSTSILQVGGQLLASYPTRLSSGRTLTPYGRFNARVESLSRDVADVPGLDDSESNLQVGLTAGVEWQMTSTVDLYGELQLDGNDGLFLGIDFNVM